MPRCLVSEHVSYCTAWALSICYGCWNFGGLFFLQEPGEGSHFHLLPPKDSLNSALLHATSPLFFLGIPQLGCQCGRSNASICPLQGPQAWQKDCFSRETQIYPSSPSLETPLWLLRHSAFCSSTTQLPWFCEDSPRDSHCVPWSHPSS